MIDGEHRDNYGVRAGVDVVVVEDFSRSLERGGEAMRKRLFSPAEEAEVNVESLWRGYLRRRRGGIQGSGAAPGGLACPGDRARAQRKTADCASP